MAVLVGLALAGCAAPVPEPAPTATAAATPATAPVPAPVAGDVVWTERVTPAGVEVDAAEPLPLVVAIHGLGDAPERFCRLFDDFTTKARVACPRAFARHGRSGWSWFRTRGARASTERDAEQAADIGAAADRLATAIGGLAASRPTRGKPIVTGFSQGGALSFALAVRHPAAIAAAVPVGGWLPPDLRPGPGAPFAPITALHGESDDRVPLAPTRDAVGQLGAAVGTASLQTFAGVGHAIPPEVRSALFAAIDRALDAPPRRTEERSRGEKERP